jgi:hypothetical protein
VGVDLGVIDSIKDIASELRRLKGFTVVASPKDAAIVLVVLGRRMASDAGSVIVPIGTMAMALPMHSRAIDFVLHAGMYERPITSIDSSSDTWRGAARIAAKDVNAWADVNAAALAK